MPGCGTASAAETGGTPSELMDSRSPTLPRQPLCYAENSDDLFALPYVTSLSSLPKICIRAGRRRQVAAVHPWPPCGLNTSNWPTSLVWQVQLKRQAGRT